MQRRIGASTFRTHSSGAGPSEVPTVEAHYQFRVVEQTRAELR